MMNDSITIPYVNESEIISVIKSLKNSSAGYDGIPASIAMPRHQFQKSISDCKIRNVTANFNILQSHFEL